MKNLAANYGECARCCGSILEKRRYVKTHFDNLRTALMWEPRGHADMYGCIVTPPVSDGADFGVLFLHNEGYCSTMCGQGIKQVSYGPHQAVIPEVEGTSYITGKHKFFIDPRDLLKNGFILR